MRRVVITQSREKDKVYVILHDIKVSSMCLIVLIVLNSLFKISFF